MDERNNHFDFDFTPIGQAIKKAREARGMTRTNLQKGTKNKRTTISNDTLIVFNC